MRIAEAEAPTALTDRETAARARLMRRAHGRILHTLNVQVSADIGGDLLAADDGTDHVCVAPARDADAISPSHMRIALGDSRAIAIAVRARRRGRHLQTIPTCTEHHANTQTTARRRVRASGGIGIRGVLKIDLIRGSQGHIVRRDIRARDGQVPTIRRTVTGRHKGCIASCRHARTALRRLIFRRLALAVARANTDLHADARILST